MIGESSRSLRLAGGARRGAREGGAVSLAALFLRTGCRPDSSSGLMLIVLKRSSRAGVRGARLGGGRLLGREFDGRASVE